MVLQLSKELVFPPVKTATATGLLAMGGDLSQDRLLLAYSQGIFPWYDEESPILWWSPPERAVLAPGEIHIGRTLLKHLRKSTYEIAWDTRFSEVIRACAYTSRTHQEGTWITEDMMQAYEQLHHAGYAHSVEVYQSGVLVGGLYGVSLGRAFFGESMFSHNPGASKFAFVALAARLQQWGFAFIDCQLMNPHVASLGATRMPRATFLARLERALKPPTCVGPWTL